MTVLLLLDALLAAAVLLLPTERRQALAVVATLVVTPVLLVAHVADTDAVQSLVDRPVVLVGAVVVAAAVVAGLTWLLLRRPGLLPLLAMAALPFRVPLAVGGSTSNLLVPFYAVIAAGALAFVITALREPDPARGGPRRTPAVGWLERALAATLVLYALQAFGSEDTGKAIENAVFFYVPFALLLVLLARLAWTRALALRCLGVLAGLAVLFALIGFVEYATRDLLLNPKLIASSSFESYFRVNSLFYDPNIYGRFLMVVLLGLSGVLLWTRSQRDALVTSGLLVVLWAGLLVTFSQSSFAGLLLGLAILGGLRWGVRRAAIGVGAVVAVGLAVVLLAPGAINLDLGASNGLDSATSGRTDLIQGGVDLAADKPVLGWGSGSFSRAYRDHQDASAQRAVSASHTIPITVAAEQGIVGLLLYLALLVLALRRLLAGAGDDPARAVVAAAFCALLLHTMLYAAFLEDPLSWALLGVGLGLARAAPPSRRRARVVPSS